MAERKIKRALISVYDKTGIVEFARALVDEFGIEIISTGGTAALLKENGIPVTLVEAITGFPEMLDGRVKTLHPKIFAAILADRDNPEHMRQLAEQGIEPIDMVVVNLYPFEKTVADPACTFEQAIEMIDIGGVALLRAAAKNHRHVLAANDRRAYDSVLEFLRGAADWNLGLIEAMEVFKDTTRYDAKIVEWLTAQEQPDTNSQPTSFLEMNSWGQLRYGENPHQQAELRGIADGTADIDLTIADSQYGAEQQERTSFNNYVDANAALALCAEIRRSMLEGGSALWHRPLAGTNDPRTDSHSPSYSQVVVRHVVAPATGRCEEERLVAPATGRCERTASSGFKRIRENKITRRNLPHIQRPRATYFITFRTLTGELTPEERDIAMQCCLFPHLRLAFLHAAVIMPDHVHLLLTPLEVEQGAFISLSEILHGIKSVSAHQIASLRGRQGTVWEDESFDHIIRDEREFREKLDYIDQNAGKRQLEGQGQVYPWLVFERDPSWDSYDSAAFINYESYIVVRPDQPARPWRKLFEPVPEGWAYRPVAGATRKETHRPVAGATNTIANASHPTPHTCTFIKHTNACGAGIAADPIEAYRHAYLGDPNAAMGGVLACSFVVDRTFAEAVMESYARWGRDAGAGGFFVEVWVAPTFEEAAVEHIRAAKPWGQRVRLLEVGDMTAPPEPNTLEYKSIAGGMLVQTIDAVGLNEDQWKVVTNRTPTESEMSDLRLAWLIAKHTKSNAISLVKDGMLVGNGAGQMSRVMSCRIATWLAMENGHLPKPHCSQSSGTPARGEREGVADMPTPAGVGMAPGTRHCSQSSGTPEDKRREGHCSQSSGTTDGKPGEEHCSQSSGTQNSGTRADGPVAASDAFFPFRDGPDILMDAGVTAIIQPGGSKRDQEVIDACNQRGVAMIFTGTRHFRH